MEQEYLDKLQDTYKEGFRDGFEYGSGKRSPYHPCESNVADKEKGE